MSLKMIRLQPGQDFDTPFDNACDGFNQRWWSDSTLVSTPFRQLEDDCWSFLDEGDEVARAVLSDATINGDNYEGLRGTITVKDIAFFEVRQQYRRRRVGDKAAAMLRSHYRGQVLSAFPIDKVADSFWAAAGFTYYPRIDRADIRSSSHRRHDPLFLFGIKA